VLLGLRWWRLRLDITTAGRFEDLRVARIVHCSLRSVLGQLGVFETFLIVPVGLLPKLGDEHLVRVLVLHGRTVVLRAVHLLLLHW